MHAVDYGCVLGLVLMASASRRGGVLRENCGGRWFSR